MWAQQDSNGNNVALFACAQPDIPGLVQVPDGSTLYVNPNVWTIPSAQFLALFTSAELTAIATSTDAQTQALKITFAANPTFTNTNATLIAAMNYLASIGLLTSARVTQILGPLQTS
jgi:hypothetical protein